jgi:EAL domain-containing protein (putative c-di-GMP-specific phosphodiesterase class I)
MSVNISAQLLGHPELVELIDDPVRKYGIPPAKLILEVTETDRLDRASNSLEMVNRLVASGYQVSIDDFGTGNATIDYLRILPAQELKIDKGFVFGMLTSPQDFLLVRSIIEMAHTLGRRVVAEGVESQAVMDALKTMGCDQAQGFHISKPGSIDELKWLCEHSYDEGRGSGSLRGGRWSRAAGAAG